MQREFHSSQAEYAFFFSAPDGTFSKTNHTLVHKASLSKCKIIEITPCTISDHCAVKMAMIEESTEKENASGKLTKHS